MDTKTVQEVQESLKTLIDLLNEWYGDASSYLDNPEATQTEQARADLKTLDVVIPFLNKLKDDQEAISIYLANAEHSKKFWERNKYSEQS